MNATKLPEQEKLEAAAEVGGSEFNSLLEQEKFWFSRAMNKPRIRTKHYLPTEFCHRD